MDDIRRWVRADGFGLPLARQLALLCAQYPYLHESTIRDCVMNHSWCDPTYDRTVPLPAAPAVPSPSYLAAFFALLQILCGEVTCSRSRSTAH